MYGHRQTLTLTEHSEHKQEADGMRRRVEGWRGEVIFIQRIFSPLLPAQLQIVSTHQRSSQTINYQTIRLQFQKF